MQVREKVEKSRKSVFGALADRKVGSLKRHEMRDEKLHISK